MSFEDLFPVGDLEPEAEPPVEQARPAWLGPPEGELGAAVPLGLVLARSERGVVALSHALAHSSGIVFDLVAHVGGLRRSEANSVLHDQHVGRATPGELPPAFLRLGVELPEGRRASNLRGRVQRRAQPDREPTEPVLFQVSGGGGRSNETTVSLGVAYWLWPLPTPGRLRLHCEWPLAGIVLTSVELDATRLLEAGGRATRIWPEFEASSSRRSAVMTSRRYAQAPEQAPNGPMTPPAGRMLELRKALLEAAAVLDRLGAEDS